MSIVHARLLLSVIAADPLGPGDHTRKITVDGRKPNYLVHVPPQYDSKTLTPVVLVFHGGGGNADVMVRFCGLNKKSDEAGFIAVYLSGTERTEKILTFKGGNCCGYAMNNNVDDVEFARKILDDLAMVANIDLKRAFATGMSNGGIMGQAKKEPRSCWSRFTAAVTPVPVSSHGCNSWGSPRRTSRPMT